MNIDLIAVDKVREPYVRSGCGSYLARLRDVMPVDVLEVRRSAQSDGVVVEGERILKRVPQDALLWVLDERGQQLTSTSLAARIKKVQQSGRRRLCLAIGGDRGISDSVRTRADLLWSLSPLTFLHEMVRLIVLEQLYRAAKINRGEPYHRL